MLLKLLKYFADICIAPFCSVKYYTIFYRYVIFTEQSFLLFPDEDS